jgi:glycosyltransferase involved in cell wall biosynthesis
MRSSLVCVALLFLCGAPCASAAEPEKFELKDGDRVVFLGNTLIEREQKYGYWELMLTMAWPERNVTFRNLGWSGDTVWGESRAGFGSQADGFKKLVEEVNAAKPTVIFVGYGNVEAFDGEKGLPKFVEGFGKLLDELEKTKARIVILGPTLQFVSVSKYPDSERYNSNVERYEDALRKVSSQRGHFFVGLTKACKEFKSWANVVEAGQRVTNNGCDFGLLGYTSLFGLGVAPELGLSSVVSRFADDADPESATLRNLSQAIVKKNELFFHRWRPQNETYLFGFRKHEQGKNAVEVFQFDPLVEAEEKKIAELRGKLAAEMKANGGAK